MSDRDMLRRGDVLKLFPDSPRHWPAHAIRAIISALPAVQPDTAPAGNLTARGNEATWALYDANLARMGALQPAHVNETPKSEHDAVQPVTVRLVFSNADAIPKTTVLDVSAEAVPDIMAWYGAYCAGDRYTVAVDGRNVPMDQNGEPAHVNETPKSEHDAANMLTPATKGAAHD